MIKSVRLQNFQSHEDTTLDFHKGVNALVGKSDSGKSAIFRALYWLRYNKPSGDAYRSHWADEVIVTVTTHNGDKIIRKKSDNENSYTVNGKKLTGFGQDVPKEVVDVLNMGDINIQAQMDKPFLIGESSGEVARYLNKIVSLDSIDATISNINKDLNSTRSEGRAAAARLADVQGQIEAFEDIDDLEKLVVKGEDIEKRINKLRDEEVVISATTTSIKKYREQVSAGNKLIKGMKKDLDMATYIDHEMSTKLQLLWGIEKLLGEARRQQKIVSSSVYKNKHTKLVKKANELMSSIKELKNEQEGLDNAVVALSSLKERIQDADINYEAAKLKFDELMPDTCPLCGK